MAQYRSAYIAEKPSLAEGIAQALAEMNNVRASKTDGYWTVGDDVVTWFFGHMYDSAQPKEYDLKWEKWTIDSLPIIVPGGKWKLNISPDKKVQIAKVRALLKDSQNIVNCGDAAREGQLLVDEALQEMGYDPFSDKVKRLWVQSMTRKDMITALKGVIPNKDKESLYQSAVCRQRADWQHGMTYTRLYTILARNNGFDNVIRVGRVQSPTLRLVVDRDREREKFRPVDHYLPKILFVHENGKFTATWLVPNEYEGLDSEGRLIDKKVAEGIVEKIQGKAGRVKSFKQENKFIAPPLPYSLSALQTECGSKFGMTAKDVLDVAQSLYEKHKATTYPRSDSRYLPTAILKDEAPSIVRALKNVDILKDASESADLNLRSSAWDDSKISDHHGIIPTTEFNNNKLTQMSDIERKVFLLIAKTFLAQFYPPFKYKAISADIFCESENFRASGRQTLDNGWKKVYGASELDEDEEEDESKQTLPMMEQGDPVKGEKGDISFKKTSPPPAFTDGTLILAMVNIHKFVTNPDIKKRLKESAGIGTEATRGDTIEKLLESKFLKREGKNTLKSTPLGQSIIDVLPEDLKDPGLTALWEGLLQQVENGQISSQKFIDAQSDSLIKKVAEARGSVFSIKGGSTVKPIEGHGEVCPKCEKGQMITRLITTGDNKGKSYLKCSNAPDCDYRKWPEAKVAPAKGHGNPCPKCHEGKLLTKEITAKSDQKKYIILQCSGRPNCDYREFPKPELPPLPGHGKECSVCHTGKMLTGEIYSKKTEKTYKVLSCSNYPTCNNKEFINDDTNKSASKGQDKPLPGEGKTCPECRKGKLKTKTFTKDGEKKQLLGCDRYPECRYIDKEPPKDKSKK